jgi:hypothetical protein
MESNLVYHGTLVWHSEPQKTMTQQPHTEIVIGRWVCRLSEFGHAGEAEAYKQALRQMEPEEACRILGRVIARVASPTTKVKE